MVAITYSNRNIGVDILKCFAAILITNSHMDTLYGKYSVLATGGSLGDALFFFVSGFALFMKPSQRVGHDFANWYKRRINRIYPTIFAIAIVRCLLGGNANIIDIILYGGGWFCSCIMIYYIFVYQIVTRRVGGVNFYILLMILLSVVCFFIVERSFGYNMYDNNTGKISGDIKYVIYFLYMLLGVKVGMFEKLQLKPAKDTFMLFMSVFLFYSLYILPRKIYAIEWLQVANIIPQMGVCYYLYKVSIGWLAKLFEKKWAYWLMRFVGGLCLEIYLVQSMLLTDKLNFLFPLNLIIVFVMIVIAAYLVRILSRLISQTFKTEKYDWKAVVQWF